MDEFLAGPRVVFGVSLSLNHKPFASDFNSLPDAFAKMVPAGIIRKKILKNQHYFQLPPNLVHRKETVLANYRASFSLWP